MQFCLWEGILQAILQEAFSRLFSWFVLILYMAQWDTSSLDAVGERQEERSNRQREDLKKRAGVRSVFLHCGEHTSSSPFQRRCVQVRMQAHKHTPRNTSEHFSRRHLLYWWQSKEGSKKKKKRKDKISITWCIWRFQPFHSLLRSPHSLYSLVAPRFHHI